MSNPKNDFSNSLKIAKATYDFSVVGGAVSTIVLPNADVIPTGAIIHDVIVDCTTAATTSASGTLSWTGGGVTLTAAVSVGSAPYTAGTVGHMLAGGGGGVTTSPYVVQKATSSAPIKAVIGTGALTAGVATIYVYYTI